VAGDNSARRVSRDALLRVRWTRQDGDEETDSAYDFFLVLEGGLEIELRDPTVHLRKGDLFVVPRGVEHPPVRATRRTSS
jgi:mannose-6-phosphate isomerase-like protein (cupin superfamily)